MLRNLAIVPIILACAASISDPPSGKSIPVTRLSTTPYSFSFYSGLGQPARLVIRDDATWHSAWASIWSGTTPTPAIPNVDFTKEMVILAALGSRPTGGYGIVVDSAMMTSNGLAVWIGTTSPGPQCITTQAFTSPVDIARIQRIDAPVGFVDVPKVVQC